MYDIIRTNVTLEKDVNESAIDSDSFVKATLSCPCSGREARRITHRLLKNDVR